MMRRRTGLSIGGRRITLAGSVTFLWHNQAAALRLPAAEGLPDADAAVVNRVAIHDAKWTGDRVGSDTGTDGNESQHDQEHEKDRFRSSSDLSRI